MNWKLRYSLAILGSLCHRTTCKKLNYTMVRVNNLVSVSQSREGEVCLEPKGPFKVPPGNTTPSGKTSWKSVVTTHQGLRMLRNQSLGHLTESRSLANWGIWRWQWRQTVCCHLCAPHIQTYWSRWNCLLARTVTQAASGHGSRHIPIKLPDGPESADIATATGQNGEVVRVQGKKEAFCREFRLRKRRLIAIWEKRHNPLNKVGYRTNSEEKNNSGDKIAPEFSKSLRLFKN